MGTVSLFYARNVISRQGPVVEQEVTVAVLVEHLAYDKRVDVVWAGEDGAWHTFPAAYQGRADQQRECWVARMTFALGGDRSLPGNVEFALRYEVLSKEYWDNNQGANYTLEADSGILPGPGWQVVSSGFESRLTDGEPQLPIVVAVAESLGARTVTVQWSSDGWQTTKQLPCRFSRAYWNEAYRSNARNPNQYGCQVWSAQLPVGEAFRVEYRICCETRRGIVRADNFGRNYVLERPALKVLILNLHCCQEDHQDDKLSQIAKAISELEVDIVCLQEVAELWNEGHGDWQTNTARIINERLASPYHLVSDWSHRGFERYREGVAILSRHPLRKHAARYVSATTDPYDIHARKVVMAQVEVPCVGPVNVFSSHLSWWEDGFGEQFQNLRQWAAREHGRQVRATLLGGDFNIKAGGDGYRLVVASNEYTDQFLSVRAPELCRRIFEGGDALALRDLDDDQRIDYVFLRRGSALRAVSARLVFTDQDYGPVSDHPGYLMTFVPK